MRGVGSVVAGTVVGGAIAVGQRLLLGPNAEAGFNPVIVTCIQRSSVRLGAWLEHPATSAVNVVLGVAVRATSCLSAGHTKPAN